MKRLSAVFFGLALAALPSSAALADTLTFDFSFTSTNGISGSGVFTAESDGNNQFLIDGVTGTTNTTKNNVQEITGLLAPGSFPAGAGSNDNLLLFTPRTGAYSIDLDGVSYELANGAEVNLFNTGNGGDDGVLLQRAGGNTVDQFATVTISEVTSPVPEPGSLVLLGTGVLGLAGAVRRRLSL